MLRLKRKNRHAAKADASRVEISHREHLDTYAWVRSFDKKNFAEVDASIAATHMMLAIEDLGLGTTWVANFDAPKLKALFPEMAGYELVAVFPVGYPEEGAAPSPRHAERVGVDALADRL